MLSSIKNNRQKYHRTILDTIEDNLYRKKRYELNFSLAIAICNNDVCMRDFSTHIRQTDKFIGLEEHLCSVVFDGIPFDKALKVTSNLQNIFQNKHFNKKLFIGIVSSADFEHDDNGYKMINSLLDVLEYSISNDMNHEIVDNYHLEQR